MTPAHKLYVMAMALLMLLSSFLASFFYYRRYYVRMKTVHTAAWTELMNKDPTIAYLGEWTRWPLGSTYFMASLFEPTDYGDVELRNIKRRAKFALGFFLCSFLLMLLLAGVLLPA